MNDTRYSITTWHGEGKSLFYVVDKAAPEEEQPAVISSHERRSDATKAIERLSGKCPGCGDCVPGFSADYFKA